MVTRIIHTPEGFVDTEDLHHNTAVPAYEPSPGPLTRVYTGAVRYTHGDAEAVEVNQARHSEPITGTPGASVASTFQGRFGNPSVELEPGNPASRTTVQVAASMGLIRQDEAGNWVDVAPAAQQAQALQRELNPPEPNQEQQGDQRDLREVLDLEAFEAYESAIEPLPQHAVDVAQAHAMAGVFQGQTLSEVVAEVGQRLASDSGMGLEPSQAAQVVRQGVEFYESTMARVAALEGIDASMKENFYASLRQGNQSGLQDALAKLVHGGDVSGFRELARTYAAATPSPTVQALQAGGFEVARTADGWVARRGSGQWVSVAELAKHAAAGAPARAPAKASPQAPAGRTKAYYNPATLEFDLNEADARQDGVDLSRFRWM